MSWQDKRQREGWAWATAAYWKERSGSPNGGSENRHSASAAAVCKQSLPWADMGLCAGWTAPRGKRGDLKEEQGERGTGEKEMKAGEGCHVSLAFKTLPDCILKSRWTKNCRLLANARPQLWHPWRCNITSQLHVKFYYST